MIAKLLKNKYGCGNDRTQIIRTCLRSQLLHRSMSSRNTIWKYLIGRERAGNYMLHVLYCRLHAPTKHARIQTHERVWRAADVCRNRVYYTMQKYNDRQQLCFVSVIRYSVHTHRLKRTS